MADAWSEIENSGELAGSMSGFVVLPPEKMAELAERAHHEVVIHPEFSDRLMLLDPGRHESLNAQTTVSSAVQEIEICFTSDHTARLNGEEWTLTASHKLALNLLVNNRGLDHTLDDILATGAFKPELLHNHARRNAFFKLVKELNQMAGTTIFIKTGQTQRTKYDFVPEVSVTALSAEVTALDQTEITAVPLEPEAEQAPAVETPPVGAVSTRSFLESLSEPDDSELRALEVELQELEPDVSVESPKPEPAGDEQLDLMPDSAKTEEDQTPIPRPPAKPKRPAAKKAATRSTKAIDAKSKSTQDERKSQTAQERLRARRQAELMRRDDGFIEHEGLLVLQDRSQEEQEQNNSVEVLISMYIKGETTLDPNDLARLVTDRRRFNITLSSIQGEITDLKAENRPPGWQDRFRELQIAANPALRDSFELMKRR